MSAPIDVRGILERAGADPDAPEGSQAWALARVDSAVDELIEALQDCVDAQQPMAQMRATDRARAALARVGGAA